MFSFPRQVDDHAARLVAAGVTTGALLAIAGVSWLAPLLALGFALRVGWGPRFDPLARVAVWTARGYWPGRPVSGPPKRFAQGIGAGFTTAATAAFALGWTGVAQGLLAVLAAFAALEAALGLCVGCRVYRALQDRGLFPLDPCDDCRVP